MCRVCLTNCRDDDEDASAIINDYKDLTGYTIDPETEPQKACQTCLKALLQFRTFKIKSVEVEAQILQMKQEEQAYLEEEELFDQVIEEVEYPEGEEILMNGGDALDSIDIEDGMSIDDEPPLPDIRDIVCKPGDPFEIFENGQTEENFMNQQGEEQEIEVEEDKAEIPQIPEENHENTELVTVSIKRGKPLHNIRYFCEECRVPFTNKHNFEHHKAVNHTGFKPYYCDICKNDFPFKSKIYLKKHMMAKHIKTEIHYCEECNKEFFSPASLYNHRIRAHMPVYEYRFQCEVCFKKLPTRTTLEIHKKNHQKKTSSSSKTVNNQQQQQQSQQLTCKFCNPKQVFENINCFKNHMRTHIKREYVCPICGQKFTVPVTLRTHLTRYHPQHKIMSHEQYVKESDWSDYNF